MNRLRYEESGVAMATVIILTFVMTALMVAISAVTIQSVRGTAVNEDWHAALGAANAGVDEYLSRLNEDNDYWVYGDPSDPYSHDSSVELPTGSLANPFFTEWTPIPGSTPDAVDRPFARYALDNSEYLSTGALFLKATGRVGDVERSVETLLRRRSFLDYLYFTNYETLDPALYDGSPLSASQAQALCSTYWYTGRDSRCTEINFVGEDEIRGPLHTNDAMLMCVQWYNGGYGPYFEGETSTSYNPSNPPRWRRNTGSGCNNSQFPTFAVEGDPRYLAPLGMPPSNTSIKQQVDPLYTSTPGCLYTGPTKIRLNSNGTMTVLSPWTNRGYRPDCGGGSETTVNIPENGVIYVQDVPSNPSSDPAVNSNPSPRTGTNYIGYPMSNDITSYSRNSGDVFIQGTLDGRLTVAAENDVVMIGDLRYDDGLGGDDLLGLVANNFVEVYHPVRSNGSDLTSGTNAPSWGSNGEPDLYAAMLSVNHSIYVQNHDRGSPRGDLNIYGVLAQQFRGVVGTFNSSGQATGYLKNYNYDTRLQYQSPPHFLDPVETGFEVALWTEVD